MLVGLVIAFTSRASYPCCHVFTDGASPQRLPGRAPEWLAGVARCDQTVSAVLRTARVARAAKMPSQRTRPIGRPQGTLPPPITSVPIFTAS